MREQEAVGKGGAVAVVVVVVVEASSSLCRKASLRRLSVLRNTTPHAGYEPVGDER